VTLRGRIARELRELAERVEHDEDRETFDELGAALLRISAFIAHVHQLPREGFAALARLAWRDVRRDGMTSDAIAEALGAERVGLFVSRRGKS
jgi:hypothetical protein